MRAALPSISASDLANVHAVTVDVPQTQALFRSREVFAHRFWLYFAAALVLVAAGVAMSEDRRSSVKLIGSPTSFSACWIASTAAPSETPGAVLNEMLVAGNWPKWVISSGPVCC